MNQLIVLLVTILTALSCALIGNFLVLRRMSLVGDAMSHAVLPGIVVAFLIAGSLGSPLFFLIAFATGILMSFLIDWLSTSRFVSEDSATGVVFTTLFAIGVLMLVRFADNVHLDQDAVLYGQVEFTPWNKLVLWGMDLGPAAFWSIGLVFLISLIFITLFYKEIKITTFDPALAESLAISPRKIQLLLVFLLSLNIITAFEAVGAILVVALLVVPPLTAYLVSKKLFSMILLSFLFAFLSAVFGYYIAFMLNTSVSGSVSFASGLLLFGVIIFQKLFKLLKR